MAKLNAKYRCLCILSLIKKICMNLRGDVLALISAVGHSRDKFWLIVFLSLSGLLKATVAVLKYSQGKSGQLKCLAFSYLRVGTRKHPSDMCA